MQFQMRKAYAHGKEIELKGTVETITGIALATGLDAYGEPDYEGTTEIDWDSQTSRTVNDSRVWMDVNGIEYLESDIEWRD